MTRIRQVSSNRLGKVETTLWTQGLTQTLLCPILLSARWPTAEENFLGLDYLGGILTQVCWIECLVLEHFCYIIVYIEVGGREDLRYIERELLIVI